MLPFSRCPRRRFALLILGNADNSQQIRPFRLGLNLFYVMAAPAICSHSRPSVSTSLAAVLIGPEGRREYIRQFCQQCSQSSDIPPGTWNLACHIET